MQSSTANPFAAIACGGTGGHLFPGLAVAEILRQRGCDITLLVSQKEVDQLALKSSLDMEVVALPAVGLIQGRVVAFLLGFWESYKMSKKLFQNRAPQAVLAMGGFTSAGPILAGRKLGAATFLHESNSIPGRATRWLAPWVDEVFTHFPGSVRKVRNRAVSVPGMPVREQIQSMDSPACRSMMGLDPQRPVLLVMGGSQGASAINELMIETIPVLAEKAPDLQYLHLTGPKDEIRVKTAYAKHQCKAVVRAFLTEMEFALNAATAVVSRAGASSLAELAAVGVPAVLIPYPSAAENHQFYNALAFVEIGAARMIAQKIATPKNLAPMILELTYDVEAQKSMKAALGKWHRPQATNEIAEHLMTAMEKHLPKPCGSHIGN